MKQSNKNSRRAVCMDSTETLTDDQSLIRAAEIDKLTGRRNGANGPSGIGPAETFEKFTPDGRPRFFPGNTFICHLDPNSSAFAGVVWLQNSLRAGPSGKHFTYLPPSSFHMTIFCGISGDPLGADGWPEDADSDRELKQITEAFRRRLKNQEAFNTVSLIPDRFHAGYSMEFVGATDTDVSKLAQARTMLEDLTRIRRPDFADYRFHVSIAYQTRWMNEEMAHRHLEYTVTLTQGFLERVSVMTLGQIEFCEFANMHEFRPVEVIGGT